MRISTAATLALTVLLVTSTFGAVAATSSDFTPATVERSPSVSSFQTLDQPRSLLSTGAPPLDAPDIRQVIRIRITDNGDAKWTIESRFLVTNDTEAETFREYANAVESGQRDAPYDPQLFTQDVNSAAESTGRDMSIENPGWDDPRIESIETDDGESSNGDVRVGIISYSFTWTNFATVDGDRIYAGDALQTADGPMFDVLNSWQRLVIEPPDNYGFVDAPTSTENGALVWNGPHEFDESGLEITILRGAGSTPFLSGNGWLIAAVLGLVLVAGASYLFARRRDTNVDVPFSFDQLPFLRRLGVGEWIDQRHRASDGHAVTTSDSNNESDAVRGSSVDSSVSRRPESGTHLEYEEATTEEIDPDLLSDEERILRMLTQNGGRMKQATIVSETGWSNAKVSQLLSKMDDDDEIEKLRIGRENLITLPGVDPTETN